MLPISWPNGWTEWAEFFWRHIMGGRGVFYIFFQIFFHGYRRALQLVGTKTLYSWVISHLNFKQILALFSKVVYGIQFSKCHYGFSG